MTPRDLRSRDMRPRAASGIALLVTLALVLVLTWLMSEFFFSTGLEVRALETYRDVSQARRLARSAFKAVEVGLLEDEAVFMAGYGQVQDLIRIAGLPLEGGIVEQLQIVSLDGLYNVNELSNMRPGPLESMRWNLFNKILARIDVPPQEQGQVAAPLAPQQVAALYATLTDWVDGDDTVYTTPTGNRGAEASAYTHTEPLYAIKNGMLDRLEELRLVLGYDTTHLPWRDIEGNLAALPKSSGTDLYPEKLDLNMASRDDILTYLADRTIEDPAVLADATYGDVQRNVNAYAAKASDIAQAVVPDAGQRPRLTPQSLGALLDGLGLNSRAANAVFETASQYLRVRLIVAVGKSRARLEAIVQVPRRPDRTGTQVNVLQYSLN